VVEAAKVVDLAVAVVGQVAAVKGVPNISVRKPN